MKEQKRFSARKPILAGAVIGLIIISFFVFGVDNPKPEWGNGWRIKPLIITPVAGALGGLFFYFMIYMASKNAIQKWIAIILGIFVFILAIWLGIVLGLDGTMWN